jgi:tetratricopeptide (TPR) repeat protein
MGRLDEAIAAYRRAVELKADRPNLAVAYSNLGHALVERGQPREALAALRTALELNPDYAQAHDGLGKALAEMGRLDEAIAAYRRAIELKPALAEAHCNLGVALGHKGRLDEAVAAYRQAIRHKPGLIQAHFNLGIDLTASGRLDEAIAAYRQVIRLKPDYPMPHYDLGLALWMKGRLDEAIAEYRRAIELKPDYAEAHCNLGDCLRYRGDFAGALAATRRGHDLGSRRRDWPYPSAQWVRECRRLVDLDARLPALLQGKERPDGAAEQSELAQLCFYRRLHVTAARLWAEAFRAEPKLADDLEAAHRYHAACAAAGVGCAKGPEAEKLPDKERGRWRRQALAWLRADLGLRARQLDSGKPGDRARVRQTLRHWQHNPDLIGLRDPASVAKLPGDEQQACKRLWVEVGALLTRANAAR